MLAFLFRRLGQSVLVIVVMTTLVFAGVFALGNPIDILISPDADQIERERAIERLGLDRPLWVQFWLFVKSALAGDLGRSFVHGVPAIDLILSRMPATLELALVALVLAVGIGIPLGLIAGLKPRSLAGRGIMTGSIVGFSLPNFWLGLMLILLFAVELKILPAGGRGETRRLLGVEWSLLTFDGLRHLILPALTLAIYKASLVIRLVYAGTREALLQDFVRFARAKGLRPARIIGVHVLKVIAIPIVTVLGLELGSMIAFAVVTETVFAWPGMGKLLIELDLSPRPPGDRRLSGGHCRDVRSDQFRRRRDLYRPRSARSADRAGGLSMSMLPITAAGMRETRFKIAWSEFSESRTAVAALGVVAVLAALALLAPWVAPQNPYDLAQLSVMDNMLPPLARGLDGRLHILGTDDQGRDMLSAILYGLRLSLFVGVTATVIALAIGTAVGTIAAHFGGRIDTTLMRLVDIQLSFPAILIALILLAILGKGVDKVVIALVSVQWAYYARTIRGSALVETRRAYMEAARCLALPQARIIVRHLLPNAFPPLIVVATVQVAHAIALEATLSFLGVGVPITEPSLGLLIANGYGYMLSGKFWIAFYPGIALLLAIVAINLVGDQLRDVMNPRLKR